MFVEGGDMVGVHRDPAQECAQPAGVYRRGADTPRTAAVAACRNRRRW